MKKRNTHLKEFFNRESVFSNFVIYADVLYIRIHVLLFLWSVNKCCTWLVKLKSFYKLQFIKKKKEKKKKPFNIKLVRNYKVMFIDLK